MASYPSDELAERRARREGRNVVPLDGRPAEDDADGLQAARHEVAVLTARVGETVAERDRMAALAVRRREQLGAARERETALRARVRVADGDLARARDQLAARTATEASLRVQATGLHARIHALRAHAAGHDARVRELAVIVEELTGVSAAARVDVERHLAAREAAEEELAAERARAADLEEEVATLHADLEALHAARDRTLGAEDRMRAARAAELGALRASSERLRAITPGEEPTLDLAAELARAAQRLRSARTPHESDGVLGSADVVAGDAVENPPAAVPAGADSASALAPAAPAPAPVVPVPAGPGEAAPPASSGMAGAWRAARSGGVRGLLHRLLRRRP